MSNDRRARDASTTRRRAFLIAATALLLAGPVATASADDPPATASKKAASGSRMGWVRGAILFAVAASVSGYFWYFGLFPRLITKPNPSRPLDAWRAATAGAWATTCLAAIFLDWPTRFMADKVFTPIFGVTMLTNIFFVAIVLPVLLAIGLLFIWNFRRDETARAVAA